MNDQQSRKRRDRETAGDIAVVGAGCLVVLLWALAVLLPLALMAAAIYYLLTH